MNDKPSLIEFPCDFPLKIIGSNTERFVAEITEIVLKHYPQTPDHKIQSKNSERGNYVSVTVTVFIYDQISLDNLYRELTSHPDIKMVL
ncbi:hypothetical protein Lqui_0438 [Legionella quinlivanii]|uniref:UPF0250 protein Lqui_0438 n=1 Tax=Legionella quinlivanii TaxID=45073 RepID=A0A0W0Y479_9GAMM|nr:MULTISPECIES: DUF493 domain-containing protein [Legionella]KTD51594.1 hypothetical protein Lqui_0438 [Legionella quinlivanii]MCE3044987.1 DUF493 domain-containing protein [Legionella sp. 16cNR16C]MCW8450932.1 DUF493 domain-containing protein [Legionella quinlivanii]SEF60102.1 hypothetical protein SAMN02746093_00576 [Legionella quinlivanii DSM 21216]STY10879.1 putative lipoate regulatory protein YbeD [Legionella quinlivanii]